MIYHEVSPEQEEQAKDYTREMVSHLMFSHQGHVIVNVASVIRTYDRYKVRGTVYDDGATGFFSKDRNPRFTILFDVANGFDDVTLLSMAFN